MIEYCKEGKGPPVLTIDELIYNHKVVLHRFFIYLAEICFTDIDETITELKDKSCIRVCPVHRSVGDPSNYHVPHNSLGNSHDIQIVNSHMEETGGPKSDDG
jgi:hypothetical protein